MNAPTCYLGGPIKGTAYGTCVDWREAAKTDLADVGITALSPMRHKEYLARTGNPIRDEYKDYPLCTAKGITARDRFDCTRADVVLFNFVGAEYASIGSCMEVGWADAARRPIVVAMEPGSIHDHGMIRECAGFIVPTLDEALWVVKAILIP